jgi:hypothetical protein
MRRRAGLPIGGELQGSEEGGTADDDNPLFGAANSTNGRGLSPDENGDENWTAVDLPKDSKMNDAPTNGAAIENDSGDAIYMFLFCGGALFQFLLICSLWMQWYRGIRGEADVKDSSEYDSAQIFYILLEFATLVWISQVSQAPKHIDPSNDTIMDSLMKSRTKFSNVTASNPVPEPEREIVQSHDQMVLEKLGWHARMVWAPLWNLMFGRIAMQAVVGIRSD